MNPEVYKVYAMLQAREGKRITAVQHLEMTTDRLSTREDRPAHEECEKVSIFFEDAPPLTIKFSITEEGTNVAGFEEGYS